MTYLTNSFSKGGSLSRWDILKFLAKSTKIYTRQAIFLVLLLLIGFGAYRGWQAWGKPLAAVSFNEMPLDATAQQKTMAINVKNNGDVFIDGKQRNEAIQFFPRADELRVKVFDNSGEFVPMFHATVALPAPVTQNQIRQIVYAVHGVGSHNEYMASPQTLVYEASNIAPSSTLTFVTELPKGLVTPNFMQKIKYWVSNLPIATWLYVAIILPGVALYLMLLMVARRRSANMFFVKGELEAAPDKIPPAIAGVLVDGVVGAREIAATLVDLARRKHIFIINKGKGQFSFGKHFSTSIKDIPGASNFEKDLLEKIFLPTSIKSTLEDVEMRVGQHIFSRKIANFYLGVYNQATKMGYFIENPSQVHMRWKNAGITLFFATFIGFMLTAVKEPDPKYSLFFWLGGMLASYVIMGLAPLMPARTSRGNKKVREWLEFRRFLTSRKQINAAAAGIKVQFEEFLPYAIVLAAEVEWVRRFRKEFFAKPEWYESSETVETLDSFASQFYPFIGYVAENLSRSHAPTVE